MRHALFFLYSTDRHTMTPGQTNSRDRMDPQVLYLQAPHGYHLIFKDSDDGSWKLNMLLGLIFLGPWGESPISTSAHKHSTATEMNSQSHLGFPPPIHPRSPHRPTHPMLGHPSLLPHLLPFSLEKPLLGCPLLSSYILKSH